jgi:hypothetical protein
VADYNGDYDPIIPESVPDNMNSSEDSARHLREMIRPRLFTYKHSPNIPRDLLGSYRPSRDGRRTPSFNFLGITTSPLLNCFDEIGEKFDSSDLDEDELYVLQPNDGTRDIYIWIGEDYTVPDDFKGTKKEFGERVGRDFVECFTEVSPTSRIRVVFQNQEPEDFWLYFRHEC